MLGILALLGVVIAGFAADGIMSAFSKPQDDTDGDDDSNAPDQADNVEIQGAGDQIGRASCRERV